MDIKSLPIWTITKKTKKHFQICDGKSYNASDDYSRTNLIPAFVPYGGSEFFFPRLRFPESQL